MWWHDKTWLTQSLVCLEFSYLAFKNRDSKCVCVCVWESSNCFKIKTNYQNLKVELKGEIKMKFKGLVFMQLPFIQSCSVLTPAYVVKTSKPECSITCIVAFVKLHGCRTKMLYRVFILIARPHWYILMIYIFFLVIWCLIFSNLRLIHWLNFTILQNDIFLKFGTYVKY